MKKYYKKVRICVMVYLLLMHFSKYTIAQCVCSDGSAPKTVSYTLTGNISPSVDSTTFKFPQFDPNAGVLLCVNAKAYVTSVIRMRLENDESFDVSNYRIRYNRNDNLTGPGVNPPVWGILDKTYGPYALTATDGFYFSGTDFISIGPDTVYKDKLFETTTSNVVPYLGGDSIFFTYKVTGVTDVTGSSNYIFSIRANDKIEFFMTYSYCKTGLLPLGFKEFYASRKDRSTVLLNWTAENETQSNLYEIEYSTNGLRFETIGRKSAAAVNGIAAKYEYQHHFDKAIGGKIYYRIKQSEQSGKLMYSPVRSVNMEDAKTSNFSVYPNPSSQKVTMLFDNLPDGNYTVQVRNLSGQLLFSKNTAIKASNVISFALPDNSPSGMYHLQARESNSGKIYTGKLLIQH